MKFSKFIFNVFGLGLMMACSGGIVHDRLMTAKVVRDCSGTYVRINDKDDYLVCNESLLSDKKEGDVVKIIYDFASTCPEKDNKVVCMLYHENKGMIRIKSIK